MRVRRLTDSTSPAIGRCGSLLLLAAALSYLLLPALLAGHHALLHNAVRPFVAEAGPPAEAPHDQAPECDQCILLGRLASAGDLPAPTAHGVLLHPTHDAISPVAEIWVRSVIPVAVLPRAPPLS